MWEKKVMEERTSEIYQRIQKKKQEDNKEAEEMESKQEHLWKEQRNFLHLIIFFFKLNYQ